MIDRSILVTITDGYASAMGHDPEYRIQLDYSKTVDETALSRGQELILEFPVESADELSAVLQIENQIAEYKSNVNYDHGLECAFNAAVLDMLPAAMAAEDSSSDNFNLDDEKLKVVILKEARDSTYEDTAEHLANSKKLTKKIGIDNIPSASTIFHWTRDLKKDCSSLSSVITRLVHAVYRNGVPTPQDTKSRYSLDTSDVINTNNLSLSIKNRTLINWFDDILDIISEPITFNRAQNTTYDSTEIIGACALAALINSPSSAPIVGSFVFDSNEIMGEYIYELVKKLNIHEINEVFREINYNIVNYASEIGFLLKTKILD